MLHRVEATAVKRVITFQIEREMKRRKLTKTEMASRMKTSRAGLERFLHPATDLPKTPEIVKTLGVRHKRAVAQTPGLKINI